MDFFRHLAYDRIADRVHRSEKAFHHIAPRGGFQQSRQIHEQTLSRLQKYALRLGFDLCTEYASHSADQTRKHILAQWRIRFQHALPDAKGEQHLKWFSSHLRGKWIERSDWAGLHDIHLPICKSPLHVLWAAKVGCSLLSKPRQHHDLFIGQRLTLRLILFDSDCPTPGLSLNGKCLCAKSLAQNTSAGSLDHVVIGLHLPRHQRLAQTERRIDDGLGPFAG